MEDVEPNIEQPWTMEVETNTEDQAPQTSDSGEGWHACCLGKRERSPNISGPTIEWSDMKCLKWPTNLMLR